MKLLDLSDLVITKICSVATMYNDAGKHMRKIDRPRWGLIVKYEGETIYTQNGTQLRSNASCAVLLPAGASYEWHCTQAGHFMALEFESPLSADTILSLPLSKGDRTLQMLRELEYKRAAHAPFFEQESIRDTYAVILMLAQAQSERYTPTEKQRQIAPALEYISQNYHGRITNDQLAALTGLSTVYFRKLFTETVGESPIVYARRLRIAKAKEMLKSDYGTLGDIAVSLGYASLYDFSRDFKKYVGVSPSKY